MINVYSVKFITIQSKMLLNSGKNGLLYCNSFVISSPKGRKLGKIRKRKMGWGWEGGRRKEEGRKGGEGGGREGRTEGGREKGGREGGRV